MRMNAVRMQKIAAMHPKMSVTKIAKQELTYEGNNTVEHSFKENLQVCRRAVIRAIRWAKSDKELKRSKHGYEKFRHSILKLAR